jgi:hypothetical protein
MTIQFSVALQNARCDAIQYGSINGSAAAAWQNTHGYTALTDWVTNDTGKVYLCTTSGTSAGSGGPTGTGTNITDGTAHWTFVGKATIEVSAKIKVYTGAQPANCAASATGTLLVEWDLASNWASAASSGSIALSSTPLSATAVGTGTAGYYRVDAVDGTTCHMQGSVTATGGGGDLTVDNTSISSGQTANITSWSITDGNP